MKEIKKSQIPRFLRYLQKFYDIYLPAKRNGQWIFDALDSEQEIIDLKPFLTALPPTKKYLFPSQETKIYNPDNKSSKKKVEEKPVALVGINCFDISSISLLDQIMTRPHRNESYLHKRRNILLIGVGPERINIANNGYDIFLEEYGNSFLAIPATVIGQKLTETKYFNSCSKKPKRILSYVDPLFQNLDKIQVAINSSYGAKIWQKVAQTCFGCGICSYVCPLCYCYEKEYGFDPASCQSCKTKRWDACFLPDFFATAGHNPRENLSDRIYNWYHHKFVRMPKEYGHIGCTDCGRCIEFCPAKINFKEVLKELIKKQ